MRRVEVSPAALGSFALHGAVALAMVIQWGSRDLKVGGVVPVTIVSSAPDLDTRPAELADEVQSAATEDPVADAPPDPVPPPSTPAPPTKSAAEPPTKSATPAAKPQPKAAEKGLDLDSLYASLTKPARNAAQRPSSATKGPSRAETAPTPRQTAGSGLAAGAALEGLIAELERRWNPNCEVEGGREVLVRVTFQLGVGGQVVGDPTAEIRSARTAVSRVGAERAVRAVHAVAPIRGLPREYYGERIAINFDARKACANR